MSELGYGMSLQVIRIPSSHALRGKHRRRAIRSDGPEEGQRGPRGMEEGESRKFGDLRACLQEQVGQVRVLPDFINNMCHTCACPSVHVIIHRIASPLTPCVRGTLHTEKLSQGRTASSPSASWRRGLALASHLSHLRSLPIWQGLAAVCICVCG